MRRVTVLLVALLAVLAVGLAWVGASTPKPDALQVKGHAQSSAAESPEAADLSPADAVQEASPESMREEAPIDSTRGVLVTVRDQAARPVAGAHVHASRIASGPQRGRSLQELSAESDSAGQCRLHLEPGRWKLRATFGELLASDQSRLAVHVRSGDEQHELILREHIRISGHVIDHLGAPVPNASISLGRERVDLFAQSIATTDASGGFSALTRETGELELRVTRGTQTASRKLTVGTGVHPPVTVQLPPTWELTGTVRDAAGQPVPHVSITAVRPDLPASRSPPQQVSSPTDEQGHYSIRLHASGTYRIDVRDQNAVVHTQPVQVAERPFVTMLDLVLPAAPSIRGRLCDADGNPLAGREVVADALLAAEAAVPSRRTRTQEDGTFLLRNLRPGGSYDLRIEHRVGDPGTALIVAAVPAGEQQLELRTEAPQAAAASVHVRLQPIDDGPAYLQKIQLWRQDSAGQWRSWPLPKDLATRDLLTTLPDLPQGQRFAAVVDCDHSPPTLVKPFVAQPETELVVRTGESVLIRPRAARADGKPLGHWLCSITPIDPELPGFHDSEASYYGDLRARTSVWRLAPGRYRICARTREGLRTEQIVQLAHGDRIEPRLLLR